MTSFTSRHRIAIAAVLAIACVAMLILSRNGVLDPVRTGLRDALSPLSSATNSIIREKRSNSEIEREKDGPAKISFAFAPKVTFANGKATKAALNWGAIEAPTLVKGAMWTATATDNTFNVLQSTVVENINDFIGPKCDEVKDEWAK